MRKGTVVFAGLLILFSSASAQDARKFAGTWKMDMARSESAHQDVPAGPSQIVIRQTDSGLAIETVRSENGKPDAFHEVLNFRKDGAETSSSGDSGVTVTGKMKWDGEKLVIETMRNVQDSTVTTLYVHSISANGGEMTVDKTLTVQHGYQFRGAATTGHGKDVFVRVE